MPESLTERTTRIALGVRTQLEEQQARDLYSERQALMWWRTGEEPSPPDRPSQVYRVTVLDPARGVITAALDPSPSTSSRDGDSTTFSETSSSTWRELEESTLRRLARSVTSVRPSPISSGRSTPLPGSESGDEIEFRVRSYVDTLTRAYQAFQWETPTRLPVRWTEEQWATMQLNWAGAAEAHLRRCECRV